MFTSLWACYLPQIEHVHLLHSPRGRADKSQEAPPVPVVITGAGELPAGCPLDDAHAPLLMGGGFPMWADDQVMVGFNQQQPWACYVHLLGSCTVPLCALASVLQFGTIPCTYLTRGLP